MIKADIVMMDETILNDVMLFRDRNLGDAQILTREEAEKHLNFDSDRIVYFSGKFVQGGLIPKQIMEYKLKEDSETIKNRIKEFVKNNNSIYDTNDTAEYIIEYREQLLKLLK
ncbi:hypothetical protein [Cytobacillus gottheilii]|uniref:hypothetical protein n=1 Tax=Cytobacillus gottheilii TaxID=859144 RepID=UPI0009BA0DD1|nr:hypothetical protein [Cytobacillus gottheilii]